MGRARFDELDEPTNLTNLIQPRGHRRQPTQTFHRILVLVDAAILPITIFHRIRSEATGESLDRWQEGASILLTLRAIGGATMIGSPRIA